MLIVFAMPGSLLMASPVRFSRRTFYPFWTRLLKGWGGVSVSVVCLLHPARPVILGFWYLRTELRPMSPQFQPAWGKALPNFWLRLASVFFGKTQFDCCFPIDAVLCFQAFLEECFGIRLFCQGLCTLWRCFFCLWAHRLLQCMHLTFSLSKKFWNSCDTPMLLSVVAKMTWNFVTTSWEIGHGEEIENCCLSVSLLCKLT